MATVHPLQVESAFQEQGGLSRDRTEGQGGRKHALNRVDIKEYNREAQRRSRAKRKAEETELNNKLQHLQAELRRAEQQAGLLQLRRRELQDRSSAAVSQLAGVNAALATAVPAAEVKLEAKRVDSAPSSSDLDTATWYLPRGGSASASSSSGPVPCAIFDHSLQAGRVRKYEVRVSVARLRKTKSLVHDIGVFRRQAAQHLGCSASDICWLYESDRHPELSGDGTLSTHLGTPACLGQLLIYWTIARIEVSAHMAVLSRLEALQAKHGASSADGAHPAGQPGVAQPVVGPPSEPMYDKHANSKVYLEAFDALSERFATVALCTPVVDVRPWRMHSPEAHRRASARLVNATHAVVARLLSEHLPRMHVDDARHMLMSLQAVFASFPVRPPMETEFEPLTARKAYRIVSCTVSGLVQDALRELDIRPREPMWPSTYEAVVSEMQVVTQRMAEAMGDFQLLTVLLHLDGDELSTFKNMKYGISAREKHSSPKAEENNLRAYDLIKLTKEQKLTVSDLWQNYQKHLAEGRAAFNSLMDELAAALPSTAIFNAGAQPVGGQAGQPAQGGRLAWTQSLIGVDAHITCEAGRLLGGLRDVQRRLNHIHVSFASDLSAVLTPKQHAIIMICGMPTQVDSHRLGLMAVGDLHRERVLSRLDQALCGYGLPLPAVPQSAKLIC